MAEPTASGGAPEATPEPTTPASPPPDPATPETEQQSGEQPTGESISPEQARKLRSEAKNLRDREKAARAEADAAKKRADDLEAAQLSDAEKAVKDAEKANKRADEAEAKAAKAEEKAKSRLLKANVIAEAAKAGFKNPERAFQALDEGEVDYDDDGEPVNVGDLVKALAESGDFALQSNAPGSGATANPAGGGETPKETDAQRRSRLLGGGGDGLWNDPKAQGGGVLMPVAPPS